MAGRVGKRYGRKGAMVVTTKDDGDRESVAMTAFRVRLIPEEFALHSGKIGGRRDWKRWARTLW